MTSDPRLQFQNTLRTALDTYHPGWEVRHHATWDARYHTAWEENRRFNVWVDTLKRWVSGDHFPRLKKFEDFLGSVDFPPEVYQDLLKQFHEARLQNRRFESSSAISTATPQTNLINEPLSPIVIGQRPLNPAHPFVGREAEVQQLLALVTEQNTRIVTVIGRSGIGKTALVSHVLHEIEIAASVPFYGIVYLSTMTAGGISLEQILAVGAELVGLEFNSPIQANEKIHALLQALQNRLVFMFFDNFEDLIDDEGNLTDPTVGQFIFQALRQNKNIRFLLTSQVELAFPRDLRHLNRTLILEEGLSEDEGIALLRNLDPNGACGLRDAPVEELRRAVQKVHGIPRALEVLVGILEDDRLARLDRVLIEFGRLHDVREMIQAGYRRLDIQAQSVIKALAIFRRPVRLEAVEYLVQPLVPQLNLRDTLQRLTRTRMVNIDRASGVISLHPIDADYAYAQLDEQGPLSRAVLERRAAAYYEQLRIAPNYWQAISDLEAQLSAFEHYVKAGDFEAALTQMGEREINALLLWGHVPRVIALRQQLVGKLGDTRQEYLNLLVLAKAYQALGQFQNAIDHFGRVMVLAAAAGDGSPMRLSYVGLGDIYRSQGQHTKAIECYLQALEASDEKDVTAEGAALLGLGLIYHQMGDDDAALERVHQALNLAEEDPVLQNKCNVMLAYIARNQGRYGEALVLCEQALHLAENAQDLNGMGNSHSILGLIHTELGHPTRAVQHLTQSIEIATTSGDIASKCQRLSRLCGVEIDRGDIEQASDYGIDALATAVRIGGWAGERLARMQLGRLALLTNDPHEAVTQLVAAAKVARAIQSNLDLYAIQVYLAQAHLRLGHPQKALDSIEPIYITAVQRPLGAMTQGLIFTKLGDAWGAEQAFQEAVATADKLLKQPPLPFRAGYIKAVALAGLAMVAEEGQPANLQKSQAALEKAMQNYRGAGALKEAAHWLDELQKIIGDDNLFTPLWDLLKIEG